MLVLLLGGARSGKSTLALELALAPRGTPTFIATGEARDDEMAARIARHQAERPDDWKTIEEPLDLSRALLAARPEAPLVIDCLSLWVSNLLERGDDADAVTALATSTAHEAAERVGLTIAVTNEVGLGIVPETPLGRAYRDLLGTVNRIWAAQARHAAFVVAGRPMPLPGADAFAATIGAVA
jgi:adenosyl cobinamide kinase/adenosyl cobinamide phosphate guanylyltransferase